VITDDSQQSSGFGMSAAFDISIRANVKEIARSLDSFTRKQLPFATAQALTGLARRVQEAETQALPAALHKKPTPFTMRAFSVIPARKATLTATVFARDAQAAYLAPSEFGGKQLLGGKRALLNPKDIALNQYGNIAKGTIARLKGRPDIFIGAIQTGKAGLVAGVWQRVNVTAKGTARQRHQRGSIFTQQHGSLRLLIRWGDGTEISPHLGYHQRAQAIVEQNFLSEFTKAMNYAIATAKDK
jgi:hypothetical protein